MKNLFAYKQFQFLALLIALIAAIEPEAAAQKKTTGQSKTGVVTVHDGREASRDNTFASEAERLLIEKEYKKRAAQIKAQMEIDCSEDEEAQFGITDTATGSFTAPKTRQKAYLYEACRSGRSFGVGGLMIVENGKTVAHFAYGENGLNSGILSLSDINQNGLTEIVLESVGTGQGYTNVAISLHEIRNGALKYLGRAEIYADNLGTIEDDGAKSLSTAHKITAQTGKSPTFFRETYQQKGVATKWRVSKKSAKFAFDLKEPAKWHKIS